MITVPDPHVDGEHITVPTDRIDDHVRQLFSCGQCHSFAKALSDETGWPALWCGFEDCTYDNGSRHTDIADAAGSLSCDCQALHLGVRTPWGTWVDIQGERTFEQVTETYGDEGFVVSTVPPSFWEMNQQAGWPTYQLELARRYVPLVLADLDPPPQPDARRPS